MELSEQVEIVNGFWEEEKIIVNTFVITETV